MRVHAGKGVFVISVLVCLWTLSAFAQSDSRTITVRVPGAAVYAAPDTQSQVLDKPAVGSAFEVVRLFGEWYEIKLPPRLGMVITGFIHQTFLIAETTAAESQKAAVQEPPKPFSREPRGKKWYVSLGGLYRRQGGYDYSFAFDLYGAPVSIHDSVDDQGIFGLQFGLGIFLFENIAVDAGLRFASKSLKGSYGFTVPSDSLYGVIAYANEPAEHKFSEVAFNFGATYHVPMRGSLTPYFGGGASIISGEIATLKDFDIGDDYHLPDGTYVVEISDPKFSSETILSFGIYFRAGADVEVSELISIFGEGQYTIASKKKVAQPLASLISGDDETVEVGLGGISATLGVKILF